MKFIKRGADTLVFQISFKERQLLFRTLKLYPLIGPGFQRLSTTGDQARMESDQQLLEEALASHREENKRQLHAFVNEPRRFVRNADGYRFSLKPEEAEWLLQVLNDLRVGSWLLLGSPDNSKGEFMDINEETAPYLWAMEMCGLFQSLLLNAWND